MTREIEFRGKVKRPDGVFGSCTDKNDGEWVFGDLEAHRKGSRVLIHLYNADGDYYRQYDVDPDTVGQFTGLMDKNGVKIFEGDIVCKRDLTFGLKFDGVVVYNSEIGCFRIHSENNGVTMRMGFGASDVYNDGQCTVPVKYNYEVIGNIYDDPEYLFV